MEMTTIKEAKINIFSVIENLDESGLVEGDAERSESVATGYLHCFDDGVILITYAESQEGVSITSEIKYDDGRARVVRRGGIVSDIEFAEGQLHRSVYCVTPYSFDAEVKTKRVRCDMDSAGGRLDLLYDMKIGGATKKCRMTVKVEPI